MPINNYFGDGRGYIRHCGGSYTLPAGGSYVVLFALDGLTHNNWELPVFTEVPGGTPPAKFNHYWNTMGNPPLSSYVINPEIYTAYRLA